ncbi:MAG TPA: hypothetical protein VF155_00075 [Candidatus Dormibacteraeota bacterium]
MLPARQAAAPDRGAAAPVGAERPHGTPWWPAAALALGTLPFITRRVGTPDYWWHTLTGRLIVDGHGLVRSDLYTYTVAGTPWTDHEYGSQVIFSALTRGGGLLAVSVFWALVVFVGFLLVLERIRGAGGAEPLIAGASLILGAAAGAFMWSAAPQMWDFMFIALELLIIERFLAGHLRALWFMPLVLLVWANLHGGFLIGILILAVLFVALAVRWLLDGRGLHERMLLARTAVATAGCIAASFLTPWGPSLFIYVWRTLFSPEQPTFIAEWQSPDFHDIKLLGFLLMLLMVMVGYIFRRPRLFDTMLVVATAALALRSVRFTIVFAVVATPVVAWQWSAAWFAVRDRVQSRLRGLTPRDIAFGTGLIAAAVAVGGVGLAGLTLRGQAASTNANFPVAAADWLAAHPSVGTRMFNQYDWGGYLAYRFYPQSSRRVFIYGEAELMGDQLLADYVEVNQVKSDWQQVLDRYGVDYVVFATGKPIDAVLQQSGRWTLDYSDNVASIFVRHPAT